MRVVERKMSRDTNARKFLDSKNLVVCHASVETVWGIF